MGAKLDVIRLLSVLLFLSPALVRAEPFSLSEVDELFPTKGFGVAINFWKKVFTEYSTREVLFHDEEDLRLIYHIETFAQGIEDNDREARRQRDYLRKKERQISRLFDDIRRKGANSPNLGPIQRRIVSVLRAAGYTINSRLLRKLKKRVRFQRGIRDKFRTSLIRSGLYLKHIKRIFGSYGLPAELAYMPHVESSFDYNAYSHKGAAGIWQFTRGTGRSYLRINRYVDERRDPIRASDAAARLLRDNFAVLKSWPLTITSYNHGKNGMLRAKRKYGTDFLKIVKNYRSRYFGFASRNFYSEFLAALEVAKNYRRYFGELEISAPLEFDTVRLTRSYDCSIMTTIPGLTAEILAGYNPHLKTVLGKSWRRTIPAGIEIRVPRGKGDSVRATLTSARSISGEPLIAADGSIRYRVQPGDALGEIASRFGTTTRSLQRLNGIKNPNRIYLGEILLISPATLNQSAAAAATTLGDGPADLVAYKVREGDNLSTIARRFNTSVRAIQAANSLSDPNLLRPGATLRVQANAARPTQQYIVRAGDTLSDIANRFGASVSELKTVNGITNPHRIQKGQRLMIP